MLFDAMLAPIHGRPAQLWQMAVHRLPTWATQPQLQCLHRLLTSIVSMALELAVECSQRCGVSGGADEADDDAAADKPSDPISGGEATEEGDASGDAGGGDAGGDAGGDDSGDASGDASGAADPVDKADLHVASLLFPLLRHALRATCCAYAHGHAECMLWTSNARMSCAACALPPLCPNRATAARSSFWHRARSHSMRTWLCPCRCGAVHLAEACGVAGSAALRRDAAILSRDATRRAAARRNQGGAKEPTGGVGGSPPSLNAA